MHRSGFLTLLLLGAACSSSDDNSSNTDAGPTADAVVAADDAGFDPEDLGAAGPDGDVAADASADGGEADSGAGNDIVTCGPGRLDGLAYGKVPATGVIFEPGSVSETTLALVEPNETRQHAYIARLTDQAGVAWAAQATSDAPSIDIELDRVRRDPNTGEVYAAFRTRGSGNTVRFYSADGALAATFTKGGAIGQDLIGDNGQANLFIVRYSGTGQVQWVKRFGPNDAVNTRRAATSGLEIRAQSVRIAADIADNPLSAMGPGNVVIDPGAAGQVAVTKPKGHLMIFELDRTSGAVATTGAINPYFVESDEETDFRALVRANGEGPPASYGVAGYMFGGGGGPVRFGSFATLNPSNSATVIALVDAINGPGWIRTITLPGENVTPRPLSLLATTNGSLITALYPNGASRTDLTFEISTGTAPVTFTVDGRDMILLHLSSAGILQWTYRIASRTERQLYRLVESNGSFYAVGQSGQGVAFEVASPNQISLAPAGAFISKHALATGVLDWVQQIGAQASPAVFVEEPSVDTNGLLVPVRMTQATVTRGDDPIEARVGSGRLSFAALRYDPQGQFLNCTEIVSGADGLSAD